VQSQTGFHTRSCTNSGFNTRGSVNARAKGIDARETGEGSAAASTGIWKLFSGERAFAEVRQQIEIGPRPSGSAEIEKARAHISGTLSNAGWQVERQEFADTTPRGPINFVNLIARYAPGDARPGSDQHAARHRLLAL
jgi:hypothetical protein